LISRPKYSTQSKKYHSKAKTNGTSQLKYPKPPLIMKAKTQAKKRVGSKTIKEIPTEVLDLLNKGEIETANLMEWLAVDQQRLLENVLPKEYVGLAKQISKEVLSESKISANKLSSLIAQKLYEHDESEGNNLLFDFCKTHNSDTVRCWAAYMLSFDTEIALQKLFEKAKYFADDSHFGVREVAWFACRQKVIEQLNESLKLLVGFAQHKSANIRRFACELTRPRGVWCKHIEALKQNPELAINLLSELKADPDKYVQDSLANWLNDASKTKPAWVQELCNKWLKENSSCKATHYIVKRALRSLK
jgi:3-methyladenine DNA glycosylase AlkC